MYGIPILDSKKASLITETSITSTNTLLKELVRLNILEEITGFSRNRLYRYTEYMNLFK